MKRDIAFNVEVAQEVGVECAVLLHHIVWWVHRNRLNDQNHHDGRYWTYNTYKTYAKLFPFWNVSKVKRLMHKLEEGGWIVSANHNQLQFDRTRWYSTTNRTEQFYLSDSSDSTNGKSKPVRKESPKADKQYHVTTQETTQVTTQVTLPWDCLEFVNAWDTWKEYKKVQHRFRYKSRVSEQAALHDLQRLSENDSQTAITYIHYAISKGWRGIYKPHDRQLRASNHDAGQEADRINTWLTK